MFEATSCITSPRSFTLTTKDGIELPDFSSHSTSHSQCVHPTVSSQGLLPSCVVNVRDDVGNYQQARVLLDSGSQVNLISTALAQRLNLPQFDVNMPVMGISQITTNICHFLTTKIKSRVNDYEVQLKF